jgi:hypothetical protein
MLRRELNQLEVHGGVRITGPGARTLAISGGGYVRVFYFSAPGQSSISGLTVATEMCHPQAIAAPPLAAVAFSTRAI